jgi:hypothetical protein
MQEKVITVPFNYEGFLKSQKIIWLFSLKRNIKYYILYSLVPIIMLTIEYNSKIKEPFSLGLFVGWGLFIYSLLKWSEFFQKRKIFFDRVYLFANRYREESMDCKFILSDQHIAYEDKEKFYRLNWSIFNPYLIFKDTILLSAKDTEGVMLSLSKKELGETDYQDVCSILNNKIGKA